MGSSFARRDRKVPPHDPLLVEIRDSLRLVATAAVLLLAGKVALFVSQRWLRRLIISDRIFDELARANFDRNELDELEGKCLRRLKSHPNSFFGNYWLGRVYFQKDKTNLAAISFEAARKLDPGWASHIDAYLKNDEYWDGY